MRTSRSAAMVLVAALLGLAAALAPTARAESSPSAYASRLITLINQARAQQGLHTLAVTGGTSTVAGNWTEHLAAVRALSHNPNLGPQLESHGSPNWTTYGENVGEASSSSADQLFSAYMNSPEHRANILGSAYRYLGVGVVFTGSTAWNTLDFVDQYSGSGSTSRTSSASTTTSSTTTAHAATPRVTHHAPTTTRKPATQAVARPPAHVASRAAATSHRTTVQHPRRHVTAVQAVAAAAPSHAPVPPVADAAPAAVPVAASLPAPVRLPVPHRDRAPILVATAAILAVIATRFVMTVRAAAA